MQGKKIVKNFVLNMPRFFRDQFFYSLVNLPQSLDQGVEFKIAQTESELKESFHLLYKAYCSVGLQAEDLHQLRFTSYHALPSTTTLIAKHKGHVVGTLSLIADNLLGLPADEATDLSTFRKQGLRLVEVSALAIRRDFRGQLLFPLLKYMYEYSLLYFGADVLIATLTTPSKAHEFYESILRFKPVSSKVNTNYSFSNNIPVVVEYLNLREAKIEYAKKYGFRHPTKNLFTFFTVLSFDNFRFPHRPYYHLEDPVLNSQQILTFLKQAPQHFDSLPTEKKSKLIEVIKDQNLIKALGLADSFNGYHHLSRSFRFPVKCPAILFEGRRSVDKTFEVMNVSREGFCLRYDSTNPSPEVLTCKIRIGDFEVVEHKARRAWIDSKKNFAGYRIVGDKGFVWTNFIDYLENLRAQADPQVDLKVAS